MINTKYVRDNIDAIKKSMEKRRSNYPVEELLEKDKKWRELRTKLQELQSKKNKASMEISKAKKEGKEIKEMVKAQEGDKEEIVKIEKEIPEYEKRIDYLLLNMPNILHESVPYGKDSEENVEIKKFGKADKKIDLNHEDLLVEKGMLDIENAAKVAGSRFYYLKSDMVLLEQALLNFALNEMVKKGYIPISPPFMMRRKYYTGVTALGDFEELLYKASDPSEVNERKEYEKINDDIFMISTSEHPIAAMHSETVFTGKELPKKYVGISPCFRREAGSHGKDTKGIFRVHQFYKIEQFIFSKPEDSWKYFEEIVKNGEELFQKLNLPYREIDICTGDIGSVAARKIDIEGYMPSQGKYRELASYSNCTDWQSLRLDIKYDEKGERRYVHTLNGTGIATTRVMVAIIENYLNADKSITIPDVLVPYIGKNKI